MSKKEQKKQKLKRFVVETVSTFAEVYIVHAKNEEEAKFIAENADYNTSKWLGQQVIDISECSDDDVKKLKKRDDYFFDGSAKIDKDGNLFYTDLEVNILSTFFTEPQVIDQDNATKNAVLPHLKSSDNHCYHFSCHGGFNPDNPLESALFLANKEPLTLGEIFELRLNKCRLITLSACETGMIDLNSISDEYIGLPSGFLFAGSPSVVSSLWTVDDLSTSFLMIKLYEILFDENQQVSVPVALKQAQNWLQNLTVKEAEKNLESQTFQQALIQLQQT
jgi:hypothetical protein